MLNDEYFFHHENKHLHENAQLDKQERYYQISTECVRHLRNSIVEQVHHMPWDESEYDLKEVIR